MMRPLLTWAWLFLRFAAGLALTYVSWTLVFETSIAALPLLAIASIFLYCTIKEIIHEIRPPLL